MHKVISSPKIELHFFQHHRILLKEKVLQETSPCFHYDHFGFLCMRIGLDSTPMASPYYMRIAYTKEFGNLVFVPFYDILVHCGMLGNHSFGLGSM